MLKHRLISGILLGVLSLVAVRFAPPWVGWLILLACSLLGQAEFYALVNRTGTHVSRVIGVGSGFALITTTFLTVGPTPEQMVAAGKWEELVLLASLIATLLFQFVRPQNDKAISTVACTLLGVFYVPYLLNFFTRLAFQWEGAFLGNAIGETGFSLVLYLVLVVKITDVGAYTVGSLIGRHKLCPRISPGKTWEGLAGGVAAAVAASCLFAGLSGWRLGKIEVGVVHAVIMGLMLAGVGTVGDLFESLIKRSAQAKDSGNLIPGMGGVLDVLDSLLFGAPALYVYVRLVLV